MTKWLNPNRNLKQILCRHEWMNMSDIEMGTYRTETRCKSPDGGNIGTLGRFKHHQRGCKKCGLIQRSEEEWYERPDLKPRFSNVVYSCSWFDSSSVKAFVVTEGGDPVEFQYFPYPNFPSPTNVRVVNVYTPEQGSPTITMLFENSMGEFQDLMLGKSIKYMVSNDNNREYSLYRTIRIKSLVSVSISGDNSSVEGEAVFECAIDYEDSDAIQNT